MSPNVLPFPVFIVGSGNMRDNLLAAGRDERWASIPAFARLVDRRGNASIGMIRRQRAGDYKIEPIRRKVRELVELTRKRSPTFAVVEQWIGISFDEVVRMKPSREAWQRNRWPLMEERMTRRDCLAWLRDCGYPNPPKSACIGCPFHDNGRWRAMRDHDQEAGAMRLMSTVRSGRGSGVFAARSICTGPVFLSTRPISRRWPTTASSISGLTSARGCAAFDVRPLWQRILVVRVQCDGPGRRSTCGTCLPTTRGAKAEPRRQAHSLSAEGHIRTDACTLFSGRAFGHRRLADCWPMVRSSRSGNWATLRSAEIDLPIVRP